MSVNKLTKDNVQTVRVMYFNFLLIYQFYETENKFIVCFIATGGKKKASKRLKAFSVLKWTYPLMITTNEMHWVTGMRFPTSSDKLVVHCEFDQFHIIMETHFFGFP